MERRSRKVALYGLLIALMLVLGLLDKSVPITWFLSGALPGVKLGLANTVLLYAIYLMDWGSGVLLMLVKAVLSGFIYGSVTATFISLSGGVLSMAVMLLVKPNPRAGALAISALSLAGGLWLLRRGVKLRGDMLWCAILLLAACLAGIAAFFAVRRRSEYGIIGTSMIGAVAFNIGQTLMAVYIMRTPQLLYTYLPFLVGMGAVVGSMTGIVAGRVFKALRVGGKS